MDIQYVELSHDGFARQSLVRRKVDPGECDWCGLRGRRFQYGTERDDRPGRAEFATRRFCSVGCFRSYYC